VVRLAKPLIFLKIVANEGMFSPSRKGGTPATPACGTFRCQVPDAPPLARQP